MIKKEQILDRAFEMVSTKGVKALNMGDLASSLKISKKTLYGYFSNKKTLLHDSMVYGLNYYYDRVNKIAICMPNPLVGMVFIITENVKFYYSVSDTFLDDLKVTSCVGDYIKDVKQKLVTIIDEFVIKCIKEGLIQQTNTSDYIIQIFKGNIPTLLKQRGKREEYNSHLIFDVVISLLSTVCTSDGKEVLTELKNNYT